VKQYTVRHRTTYHYHSDVAFSRLIAHVVPRATARQQRLAGRVTVNPVPAERSERTDFFGNTMNAFTIDEPHAELDIFAESQVTVAPIPPFVPQESLSWEAARASLETPADSETFDAVQYAFDTPLTATNDAVLAFAQTSFAPGRPLFACALELNARIHADFRYDKDATDTRTTVPRVFELHAGVCQDLAHAGVAAVRSMGLAARYVSGYLLTHPAAGRERMIGADASHAWFAVWIPPFGWVDFDPTNDMLPSSEHVTVAWGRDYGDVAPIHGIITGGGENEVKVAVDVVPVEI
jgi:transglutaminase-like putative cysteine protease